MSGIKHEAEGGVTLVEFMIGLGIMSLVAYAVTHFFSRVTQSDAELSAKAKAQSELVHLFSILEKDLKFRDINNLTDLCEDSSCKNLSITRLATAGGTYTINYTSTCHPVPAGSYLSQLNFNVPNSQCIQSMNCATGTYPGITIDIPSVAGSERVIPPPSQKRAAYNLVGMALCAGRTRTQNIAAPTPHTVSQDRIILEGAYLGANQTVLIERKETVFSSNNMAKIQMLPN